MVSNVHMVVSRGLKMRAVAMALALVAVPQAVRAGCIAMTLAQASSHPGVTAIFRGTVVSFTRVAVPLPEDLHLPPMAGQIATVRVIEVWKGDVLHETPLYFGVGLDGQRLLDVGGDYLFIASQLDAFGRRQFNVPPGDDQRLYSVEYNCGAIPFASPYAQSIVSGTPGHPPR
jgi:hypothetical protein